MGSLGRIKFLESEDWFDKGYGIVGGTNDTNMEFGFQIMPWRVGPALWSLAPIIADVALEECLKADTNRRTSKAVLPLMPMASRVLQIV